MPPDRPQAIRRLHVAVGAVAIGLVFLLGLSTSLDHVSDLQHERRARTVERAAQQRALTASWARSLDAAARAGDDEDRARAALERATSELADIGSGLLTFVEPPPDSGRIATDDPRLEARLATLHARLGDLARVSRATVESGEGAVSAVRFLALGASDFAREQGGALDGIVLEASARADGARRLSWIVKLSGIAALLIATWFGLRPVIAAVERALERSRVARDEERERREDGEVQARAREQLVASLGHEIRTPLNAVTGSAELLLASELDAQQRAHVNTVRSACTSSLAFVEQVLEFASIEAGEIQVKHGRFDPRSLVEEVLDVHAVRARSNDVELFSICEPDVDEFLTADARRLRQVLANLVGNATKFTRRGQVAVHLSQTRRPSGVRTLRFEVEDTGIGIPEEALARVFDAYEQASETTLERYGGTGLGLSVARRVVQALGGRIGVESEVGIGSTFWFEVPVTVSEGARVDAVERHASRIDLAGALVAVVDDSPAGGRELEAIVQGFGGRVEVFDDHAALLEAVDAERIAPRVCFVTTSPDRFAAERITRRLIGARLVEDVVWVTPGPDFGARETGLSLGVGACLPRPLTRAAVARALEAVLVEHAPSQPAPPKMRPALGLRVLLVEDNPVNSRVTRQMVERLGCTCQCAENGKDALGLLERETFDAVLMDCQLPGMDGYEVTRALRTARVPSSDVPVVALTAHASAADRDAAFAAGMDEHLVKPVGLDDLARVLQRIERESVRAA